MARLLIGCRQKSLPCWSSSPCSLPPSRSSRLLSRCHCACAWLCWPCWVLAVCRSATASQVSYTSLFLPPPCFHSFPQFTPSSIVSSRQYTVRQSSFFVTFILFLIQLESLFCTLSAIQLPLYFLCLPRPPQSLQLCSSDCPFPLPQTLHYDTPPTHIPTDRCSSFKMLSKTTLLVALVALTAQVATAATPPACLVYAVKYVQSQIPSPCLGPRIDL